MTTWEAGKITRVDRETEVSWTETWAQSPSICRTRALEEEAGAPKKHQLAGVYTKIRTRVTWVTTPCRVSRFLQQMMMGRTKMMIVMIVIKKMMMLPLRLRGGHVSCTSETCLETKEHAQCWHGSNSDPWYKERGGACACDMHGNLSLHWWPVSNSPGTTMVSSNLHCLGLPCMITSIGMGNLPPVRHVFFHLKSQSQYLPHRWPTSTYDGDNRDIHGMVIDGKNGGQFIIQ